MSRRVEIRHDGQSYVVTAPGGAEMEVDGQRYRIEALDDDRCLVTRSDGSHTVVAHAGGSAAPWLFAGGRAWTLEVAVEGTKPRRASTADHDMTAPMPATVVAIAAAPGTAVAAGDPVVVLEAMKMELVIRAPRDGVVAAVHCRVGDLVPPNTRLAEMAP